MKPFLEKDLATLIADIDAAGGPASPGFPDRWAQMQYQPTHQIAPDLDPYSPAYMDAMLSVYREISGARNYLAAADELLDFDVEAHVKPFTSYGNIAPDRIALHFERLACAIRRANLPAGASILDMGCGWGLSSEFLVQCGFKVTAVDINPKFVELVNRRAQRLGYPIRAMQSSFQGFSSEERFDAVLFYECLHHEREPWSLLAKVSRLLKPNGKILLAGEPIQDLYWKHWGLRLDTLSVYCIRKFGWFESGWSRAFLTDMLARQGFLTSAYESNDPSVGIVITAERLPRKLGASELGQFINPEDWFPEGDFLISRGNGKIDLPPLPTTKSLDLVIHNFRGRPISFRVNSGTDLLLETKLSPGENVLHLDLVPTVRTIEVCGETWHPGRELGTPDQRELSFHLLALVFPEAQNALATNDSNVV